MACFWRRLIFVSCAAVFVIQGSETSTIASDSSGNASVDVRFGSMQAARHFSYRSVSFSVGGRRTVLEDFALQQTQAMQLRVSDLVSLEPAPTSRTYGLAEAARALHPFILIDAGSAGTVGGIPKSIGLIVSGGRVVAPLTSTKLYGSGMVCISPVDGVRIIWANRYREGECPNAVQSGPLIIDPGGAIGISSRSLKEPSYRHSVMAVEHDGTVHLLWSSPTHLFDIALYLHQIGRFVAAINLGIDGGIIADDPPFVASFGDGDKAVSASIELTH